ncbi:TetR/AcrR family transcriptional regulator [Pararhodobacter sp.]|uniref:TetR/AcrR family transcriptional regulator n=1 Tax=Pararhodobacter sp. TaxID=2127056 RepID=UPI002FDE3307
MTQPPPLFAPDTARGRLLAVAARLFREKGYAGTTVRDIAGALGILSGSLFHHFRSKEDILFAVMESVIAAMRRDLETALADAPSPHSRVRALIAVELAYLHGPASDATSVLFHDWRALSAERQAPLLQGRNAYFALWQDTLAQARAAGLTPVEPEILRQFLHGALAWTSYWYRPDGGLTLDDLTDRALALALGMNQPAG